MKEAYSGGEFKDPESVITHIIELKRSLKELMEQAQVIFSGHKNSKGSSMTRSQRLNNTKKGIVLCCLTQRRKTKFVPAKQPL